jgi:hypothetical protein
MPSVSRKQQEAMAIAEHDPDKLYERNEGLTKMSHQSLHDFAATPRTNLPESAPTPPKISTKQRMFKRKY